MIDAGSEPIKMLLVEDSPADAFLVQEAIRAEGLPVRLQIAEDGEAAIQLLDRLDSQETHHPLDLLLLDINIPRQDGNAVLQHLRRSTRCGDIPVIMISSSDSPRDRKRAFELGATEYFHKPSNLDEFMRLGKLVRRLCEQTAA